MKNSTSLEAGDGEKDEGVMEVLVVFRNVDDVESCKQT